MIITELYDGQGLGNQLWCYVTTRVIAKDRGYEFGIKSPEKFKGKDFLSLDFGNKVVGGNGPEGGPPTSLPDGITHYYEEKSIIHPLNGSDIRTHDAALVGVADGTKIDGCMQDEQYIAHHKDEIKRWLAIKLGYECLDFASDDICVINFRGSGYVSDKDFFLSKKYWRDAMRNMLKVNPRFKFVVVTEDVKTAKKFFPDLEVHHWSIAKDYAVIHSAHYLILSNSSFAWFPAWTSNRLKYCIAPKYWARHNISDGYWSLGYNITSGWMYQDRKGDLFDYDTCKRELEAYMAANKDIYSGTMPFTPTMSRRMRSALRRSLASLKETARPTARKVKKIFRKARGLIETIKENSMERRVKESWLSPAEIAEYRKKIKIYDIFTFFNELDLLEIRLNILDPYVDYFVIVEASETFSGNKKPLYFKENKERYKKWAHKIIYHAVTDIPADDADLRERLRSKAGMSSEERKMIENILSSDIIDHSKPHWVKEFYIKESVRMALSGLNDDDICYVSDLDEIWNPNMPVDYSKDDIFRPRQVPYMYYLNNRSDEDWRGWTGTIVTKYKNIRTHCLGDLRTHKKAKVKSVILADGGWHFTFQGGAEGAHRKIEESDHPFYASEKTLPGLSEKVGRNVDYRGRDIRLWVSERGLPAYLLENKEKYRKFFK